MSLNPTLQAEIDDLQGTMRGQAEKTNLPERFTTANCEDRPAVIITDTITGKSTTVSLFAYSNVREALSDLL